MTSRPVLTTYKNPNLHWVGDGFYTQSMLPVEQHAHDTSPFLIAGYNPEMTFAPTDKPRGVGLHPHRGFETVTIVFQGEVQHGDTMGNRGVIGSGDVQWMTAARGVQHEEFHSDKITAEGGTLEMVQLWVNLPAARKLDEPRYQEIRAASIPEVSLPGGSLRVIAGEYDGTKGPTETASPLHLWDLRLGAGSQHSFDLPEGMSVSLLLLKGRLQTEAGVIEGPDTVIYQRAAGAITLAAETKVHALLLAGEPLNEPIAMGGPFVMTTQTELRQAWQDYRMGRF